MNILEELNELNTLAWCLELHITFLNISIFKKYESKTDIVPACEIIIKFFIELSFISNFLSKVSSVHTIPRLFSSFSRNAIKAASNGQVHVAEKNGQKLAVKVQYPGVADSVKNDLRMLKPIAMRILNLKESEIRQYLDEVEERHRKRWSLEENE